MPQNILLISPYHTGSHKAWAAGWQAHSTHNVELLTLKGQFWKWRMQGGAVTLAQKFMALDFVPDHIVVTDMLDLATFLGLAREKVQGIPITLYMHENQLNYPQKTKGWTPAHLPATIQQFAFINYTSMMAADRIFFNSHYHKTQFFNDLPVFLNHFPDNQGVENVANLEAKSAVLPVGINLNRLDSLEIGKLDREPPLILWNQRWEYDKNPKQFFQVLFRIAQEGIPFRVAICGENFQKNPETFLEAQEKLGERVIHFGYADSETYKRLLWESAVTLSTAKHEFFGISILEAIYTHTFPILPQRLSYPELIPAGFHIDIIYTDFHDMLAKLRWALAYPNEARETAKKLALSVAKYDWQTLVKSYDKMF